MIEKITVVVLMILGICVISGCGNSSKIQGYTVDELKKQEGTMLKVTLDCGGEYASDEEILLSTCYLIRYDGTIQIVDEYNLKGSVEKGQVTLSDEDYEMLIRFLDKTFKGNKFERVDALDGPSYEFEYFDTTGQKVEKFITYIYEKHPLAVVTSLLTKYEQSISNE